jgi:cell division protein FtsB
MYQPSRLFACCIATDIEGGSVKHRLVKQLKAKNKELRAEIRLLEKQKNFVCQLCGFDVKSNDNYVIEALKERHYLKL